LNKLLRQVPLLILQPFPVFWSFSSAASGRYHDISHWYFLTSFTDSTFAPKSLSPIVVVNLLRLGRCCFKYSIWIFSKTQHFTSR
jgi:hypothetical protein